MTGGFTILVAPSARKQASRISDWWASNREKAPHLFADELAAAFVRLASAPMLVRVYRESKGRRIRRLLLPRTSFHVFFAVDEAKQQVHVLAIWHTARARGPRL